MEEGIVAVGGTVLVRVAYKLERKKKPGESHDFDTGYQILLHALRSPIKQIALNAGREDGAVIIRDIEKRGANIGYDASSEGLDARLVDMLAEGILDTVKVTRSGVQHAASAAAVLRTTAAAIADEPDTD